MGEAAWRFAIDVGGTFCDVLAVDSGGETHVRKVLSSGRVPGVVEAGSGGLRVLDRRRCGDPDGFWNGGEIAIGAGFSGGGFASRILEHQAATGTLTLESSLPAASVVGEAYQLRLTCEAPILAIRHIMGLRAGQPIEPCSVRFGTTRATNALLERKGARTGLIVTRGFGDLLLIGDQTRPALFDLNIVKPVPLSDTSVEVDERIDADGIVLRGLDEEQAFDALERLRAGGVESVAICLLNAYRNPVHEIRLAELARRLGFEFVSTSAGLSPSQGMLRRAENCVADAYLAPALRRYVGDLEGAFFGGRLRLMTGAGGLVGADGFNGSSSIMSGPAGGLVGAVDVARRAGFAKTITFDMGGTSTDVSRFDGQFELQHETVRAGVRIASPILAIETVAAGGGSVCSFDGQRFLVGPESAGSHPGPACYGRGGPLTVTDANVLLGRVPVRHFPFRRDAEAVRVGFEALADAVRDATGRAMGLHEIADGFVRIANESMAAAVRRITIERGVDPSAYALTSFGGAGGQHACAVARLLGIETVVVPGRAGVLSAYGIAIADVKRFVERAVHSEYGPRLAGELEDFFSEMEREGFALLEAEGIPSSRVLCDRWIDARYAGEGGVLTVPAADFAVAFERLHRQRFGYIHDDRAIEVVSLRVEAVGGSEDREAFRVCHNTDTLSTPSDEMADVWFDGRPRACRILDIGALRCGELIDGPAVIAHATSTTVIDPGWSAEVGEAGDLLLADSVGVLPVDESQAGADPVRLSLFNHHFAAVAEQMGAALRRTAISTNVKERLDFSCAVFDRAGELVANAPHIPVHLGSMGVCVKAVMEDVGSPRPGDVVITNNPFRGGTHLPDVTVVTPVFADGSLAFFVASRAHHAEIGGAKPGSMPADSTRLTDEGVLIDAFKIVDGGRARFDALERLLRGGAMPSRNPRENLADVVAQVAANQAGVEALLALTARYGCETVDAFTRHVREAADVKMRRALLRRPAGVFKRCDTLDDGSAVCVTITIDKDEAVVDFTGTGGVHAGNFNATPAVVASAVLYCFRCLIGEDIPLNAGVLGPIRIHLPPCMLNPPLSDDPPAVAAGNVETSQRILDVILGALGVVAGGQGTMNNVIFGNERFGYYETICGGAGAGAEFDGADAVHTHMTNTRMTDTEILEARYPVRVRRFAVRRDSGGGGRHRGGDGCVREIEFLAPVELSLITQRRTVSPYGLEGGAPGTAGENRIVRADGGTERLGSVATVRMAAGDRLIVETPGGGGFGEVFG